MILPRLTPVIALGPANVQFNPAELDHASTVLLVFRSWYKRELTSSMPKAALAREPDQ